MIQISWKHRPRKFHPVWLGGKKTGNTNKQHAERQARHQHGDVLGVVQHGREDKGKLKERSLTLSDSSKCLAIFQRRRKSSSTNEGLHLTSSKSAGSLREVDKKERFKEKWKGNLTCEQTFLTPLRCILINPQQFASPAPGQLLWHASDWGNIYRTSDTVKRANKVKSRSKQAQLRRKDLTTVGPPH